MSDLSAIEIGGAMLALVHLLGLITAVDALFKARTAQGSIAWILSLLLVPLFALPAYLLFGSRKFSGYTDARRAGDAKIHRLTRLLEQELVPRVRASFDTRHPEYQALERLVRLPFARFNEARLLIDGEATFAAMFKALEEAGEYVLAQFYIVRDDGLGKRFQSALIACAARGVRVHLLYDSIGCYALPERYLRALVDAGVRVSGFGGAPGRKAWRFQINFRNHRKILVIDGRTAFVGGHNVGDEYLGRDPKLRPWRDTHVQVHGPAAIGLQISFLEDWFWMRGKMLALKWDFDASQARADQRVLVAPSGPADDVDTCSLLFIQLINSANQRVWIVSPYFVPDEALISALQLAVFRGVDVRILLPEKPDHRIVWLAAFAYLEDTLLYGVRVFRYMRGFLHQKVALIDDRYASVGTANLDNRSFRLNFEITLLFTDADATGAVERMFRKDFADSREVHMAEINRRASFRFAARLARLFAPLL